MPVPKTRNDPATAKPSSFKPIWAKTIPLRFAWRVAALSVLALAGYPAYAEWLGALFLLATAFCVCVAEWRREPLFGGEFTHWDEAAAFALLVGATWLLD